MHGGAAGTGTPKGNRVALKAGQRTRAMIELRQVASALLRCSHKLLRKIG
jgi:hypothetical protein